MVFILFIVYRNKTNWSEIRHIRENVGPHVDIDM